MVSAHTRDKGPAKRACPVDLSGGICAVQPTAQDKPALSKRQLSRATSPSYLRSWNEPQHHPTPTTSHRTKNFSLWPWSTSPVESIAVSCPGSPCCVIRHPRVCSPACLHRCAVLDLVHQYLLTPPFWCRFSSLPALQHRARLSAPAPILSCPWPDESCRRCIFMPPG